MSWNPDRIVAKTIAWAFIVVFFGFLLHTYLKEGRPSTAASGTATPGPTATLEPAATPGLRASSSPTAARETPGPPEAESATHVLTLTEAIALGNKAMPDASFYLRGDFVVTASGKNRAVLRAENADVATGTGPKPAARVLVEFPDGVVPPVEGARMTFSGDEVLEIIQIRRDADGLTNIYTRRGRRAAPVSSGHGSVLPASALPRRPN